LNGLRKKRVVLLWPLISFENAVKEYP